MPSRTGQEELLLRLHRDIGLDPNETSFVEVRKCLIPFETISRFSILRLTKSTCGKLNFKVGSWDRNTGWVCGLPRLA